MRGLPAEPGQVPDEVRFEEDEEGEGEQAAAARASSGAGASTSNAAAAAAAGLAAAALPAVNAISTTPRPHDHLSPRAVLPGHAEPAAGTRNVLGGTVERPQTSGTPSAQLQHAGAGPASAAAAAGQRMVSGLQAWRGKVAVVTGASSGIGWGVCEALGRAGLRVVAVARRRWGLAWGPGLTLTGCVAGFCDHTKYASAFPWLCYQPGLELYAVTTVLSCVTPAWSCLTSCTQGAAAGAA